MQATKHECILDGCVGIFMVCMLPCLFYIDHGIGRVPLNRTSLLTSFLVIQPNIAGDMRTFLDNDCEQQVMLHQSEHISKQ